MRRNLSLWLAGMQVSSSWSDDKTDDKDTGSATGEVVVDASGKPNRIGWTNDVVFTKQ